MPAICRGRLNNIGKDLQFIRVNGTLVGGTIRLVLYLLSQLPSLLPALSTFKEKKWLTLPFPWRSATVCAMRSETTAAIISNWSWNSSTLSFIDFISEKLGPVYYNAGIEEAIHASGLERAHQEEMDLKKIL